jgi:MinD superfamily P-loop ATPase
METWALPEIDEETCDGCGDCVEACHASAVSIVGGRAAVTQPGACDYCTDCEAACPAEAIRCPFEIAWA